MFQIKRRAAWLFAVMILASLFTVVSCSDNSSTNEGGGDSFGATLTMTGGSYVSITGSSSGYQPGQPADFTVTILNNDSGTWSDGYCLLLVDVNGPQAYLGEKTFSLTPEDGIQDIIHTVIPEEAVEGPYGVSVVVPSTGTVTGTIWVGPLGENAGPWPAPTECISGPMGQSAYTIDREPFRSVYTPVPAE